MDTTKLLLGTLAGTVTSFLAGGLIFGFLLANYMEANMEMSTNPNFVWILVGHIIMSFLITYIFLQWAGISTLVTGAKAGALIGLLIALSYAAFLLAGTTVYSGIESALVDTLGNTIVWAAGGAGIGWYLGRK